MILLRCVALFVTVALVATSCSGSGNDATSTTKQSQSATASKGSATLDVAGVVAAASRLDTASLNGGEPLATDLVAAMGVAEALGDDGVAILTQADEARSTADGQLPGAAEIVSGLGKSRKLSAANEILWVLIEFLLPLYLDNLTGGIGGPEERTEEAEPEVATGSAPGTTSTVNQTTTVGVTGSVVEVILRRIEHEAVTDPTTGAQILERTDDRTVTGTIDVSRHVRRSERDGQHQHQDRCDDAPWRAGPGRCAQRLWQHGRCVVVMAPDYNAETPIDTGQQNSSKHTENVDKGSTTNFAVTLRQRFSGGVTASTQGELVDGKKSLDPKSMRTGEGALTYVADDEDDKDAPVKLTSTCKRGIGTLVLTFHTGTKQLTVTISGSELFDGDIDTKLTYSPVLITKQSDGTFSGGGSSDAKGTFPGCSGIALSETGNIGLTATQATNTDGTPGDWNIVSAMVPTNSNVVVSCNGQSLPGVATFFGGVGYNFVHDLGTMTAPAEGGTLQLHKDGSYGPIDATVVVVVPKGNG